MKASLVTLASLFYNGMSIIKFLSDVAATKHLKPSNQLDIYFVSTDIFSMML